MLASIIIIGDEILLGQVTDTNSGAIARMLGPMGWRINTTRVVGDDPQAIRDAVNQALSSSDLVITTGGLGPTKDDITKRVLTEVFGGTMIINHDVTENIKRVFEKRGIALNRLTEEQALVPSSCRVIQNVLGTAPIMWFERDGRVLISMPGVPFETVGMMQMSVLEEIRRRFSPDDLLLHHTIIVSGMSESALAERLEQWEDSLTSGLHLAYLPVPGYIRLRLDGVNIDEGTFNVQLDALKALVKDVMLYDGDATPAEIILEKLKSRGLTVSTAESCTGGNIAHRLTSISGSSECFMGSVVSYSNDVKHRVLGVSQQDLDDYGAVSQPVVTQMVTGVARLMATDCAVATSGIAGPGGGSPEKPVGTVWIAAHALGQTVTKCYHFPGDRSRVIDRATTEALLMLIKFLEA